MNKFMFGGTYRQIVLQNGTYKPKHFGMVIHDTDSRGVHEMMYLLVEHRKVVLQKENQSRMNDVHLT